MKKTENEMKYYNLTARTNPSVGKICPQKSKASGHRNENWKAVIQMSASSIFPVQEVYVH